MFELARRVQGVDVDGDEAGAKNAAQRDRVLQDIGQHDGDTLTPRKPERLLQVAGELQRQFVQLPIAERSAHVAVCGALGILLEGLFKQLPDRAIRRCWQLLRHAWRV